MNVKERIEKIKRKHVFETGNEQDFIRAADIVWLLKMAEVNEKWSGQLSELNKFLKGRADDIQEGHQLIYVAMELIRRLEKENEQHKQALEYIRELAEYDEYENTVEQVYNCTKKALEETE